jgi:acyl-CoA thioesterase-1
MSRPDIRVCFLGDSFTLGTGDPEGLGWVGRVLAAEQGRGVDLTVYNLGVRGQTGAQIAERTPGEVGQRIADRGDRRGVVFSFGTNDIYLDRPLRETLAAAEGLLRWAQGEGHAAFVVSPPPADDPGEDAALRTLGLEIGRIAAARGAPFLDIREAAPDWSAWFREASEGDGVHPGAEGYRRVAAAFGAWNAWRDWLDR